MLLTREVCALSGLMMVNWTPALLFFVWGFFLFLYKNRKLIGVCPRVRVCFLEKLEGEKLNVAEVTQSEIAQKQKLQTVLERINDSLKLSTRNIRWNVDCKELRCYFLLCNNNTAQHNNPVCVH